MTAITLHLPDDLAARLAALPDDEINTTAALALADLVNSNAAEASETGDDVVSAEEAAYLAAGIRRGLQAAAEGRERPLVEYAAEFEARHGSSRREVEAAAG